MNVDVQFDKNSTVFTCEFKEVTTVHGATFTPHVSEEGVLSWTNDKNLPNPSSVCIKGEDGSDGYTPVKGVDYFTEEDKAGLKMLRYDAQELTRVQKEQARQNIGAAERGNVWLVYDNQFSPEDSDSNINMSAEAPITDENGEPIVGRVAFYEAAHDGACQLINVAEGTDPNHAATVGQVVLSTPQTLTEEQKAQVRENIGIIGAGGITTTTTELQSVEVDFTQHLNAYVYKADGLAKEVPFGSIGNYGYAVIPVTEGEAYHSSGRVFYNAPVWLVTNANGVVLQSGYGVGDMIENIEESFTIASGGAYLYINKNDQNNNNTGFISLHKEVEVEKPFDIDILLKSNVLFGKKYVACGDSFTEGDFTNYTDANEKTAKNSDAYDADMKMYKTYPWWIAKRNNMTLVNEAKCGSDFTNISGASNAFSVSRYTQVPADADYITLMFGLNETNIGADDSLIGAPTDTTDETLWGAWNIVFEHFLTNMPYAKIGVIIADAWMTETYANAVVEICERWGIPCLNFKGDASVPMMIGGKFGTVASRAVVLRNAAFKVSDSDAHPNLKAHEYMSTIIENFMRSL